MDLKIEILEIIMFNGFSMSTNNFFKEIMLNNSRQNFIENKSLYDLYVKKPLTELFYELLDTIMSIDSELEYKLQRCISTPYTDARFMPKTPIKEYMYLRYKLCRDRKTDIPGFFFDASVETIRFGLKVYNITSMGMESIRLELKENLDFYNTYIKKLDGKQIKMYDCEMYKKDHFPHIKKPLNNWLNSKDIRIYKLLPDNDIYFSSKLANEIEYTFRNLEVLYKTIKIGLDKVVTKKGKKSNAQLHITNG